MDPLTLLLIFLALSKRDGAAAPAGASPVASPTGPFAFPPSPTPVVLPAGQGRPGGPVLSPQWRPYAPLNEAIISRAQQLLLDAGAKTETIEPDPTRPGQLVRFLKLHANGKLNVTAQMPRAGAGAPVAA